MKTACTAVMSVLLAFAATAHCEDAIEAACKAHGNTEALLGARTLVTTGVFKNLYGGLQKYDFVMKARFPNDLRQDFKGAPGTYGSFGFLKRSGSAWKFSNDTARKLWPDEIEDLDQALFDVALLERVRKGEVKHKTLPGATLEPDSFECAGVELGMTDGRKITLWFDKSTGLLYRMDETTTNRDGSTGSSWVVFEDYEDMAGGKWATTRSVYVNMLIPGTKSEKFQLVQKTQFDTVDIDAEVTDDDFAPPADEFGMFGAGADEMKKKVEFLLGQFKGRRQPDRAALACVSLSRLPLEGAEAARKLIASGDKDLEFFGALTLIRAGMTDGIPEAFDATASVKRVTAEMGYKDKPDKTRVLMVGAAGIRATMGGKEVFIDALYQSGLFNTQQPALDPSTIVAEGLILCTHAHRDSFDPWIVAEVANRTSSKVVGPPAVIAELKKRGARADLLLSVQPAPEKPESVEVMGFRVHAMAVPHLGEYVKGGAPEHVAFAVKRGSALIVHTGDADQAGNLDEAACKGADVLFIPHWMASVKHQVFFNATSPRFIVPIRSLDAPGTFAALSKLRESFPKVVPMLPGQLAEF